MATVTNFLNHLRSSSQKSDPAGLMLINFFTYYGFENGQLLGRRNFDRLISVLQQDSYWDNKRDHFFEFLSREIKSFSKKETLDVDLARLSEILKRQVIAVQNPVELVTIVSRKIKKKKIEGEKIKLKVIDPGHVMCLVMTEKMNLEVLIYSNRVGLSRGALSPLLPRVHLFYDANMDLKTGCWQRLSVESNTYNFFLTDKGIKGCALTGSSMQLKEKMVGPFGPETSVFFPLKVIEQHYIDFSSDPYYLELCNKIDECISLLKANDPGAYGFAKKSIKSAYLAIKYVFSDDKHLKDKLLELERTIQVEYQCANKSRNLLD